MKDLLKFAVIVCRNTPEFRGKWRLVKWLENNKSKCFSLDPFIYSLKGCKMRCDPTTNFHLFIHGPEKNKKIIPIIDKYVKPGQVVVDVGAHSGYFTICLSKAVGDSGKVYAYEASPVIYKELCHTVNENKLTNVSAINKAMSEEIGQVSFFLAPNWKSEISSLRPGEGEKINIEATKMDVEFQNESPVTFVKIDVEGAEMKVLYGMDSVIRRDHPVMVIEITDKWLKELGHSSIQVFEYLHSHGYKIYEIGEQDLVEVQTPPDHQIDGLCIPSSLV
jgi:FkbM family methyltransferase